MSNLKTNIMIYEGILEIVEEIEKPPKCVDIKFNDDMQEKLNKLIDKQYDLIQFGVNFVDYACSRNGQLYKIVGENEEYDEFELIKFSYEKDGFNLNKFNKMYKKLNNKNLNDISFFICNFTDGYKNFMREHFNIEDLKILDEFCSNISKDEINLFDNYLDRYTDEYLLKENKISYGYSSKFDGKVGLLQNLNDNELINGYDERLEFWINGWGYVSAQDTFIFPGYNDDGNEFNSLYLNHFSRIILPILHKIFKLEGLE